MFIWLYSTGMWPSAIFIRWTEFSVPVNRAVRHGQPLYSWRPPLSGTGDPQRRLAAGHGAGGELTPAGRHVSCANHTFYAVAAEWSITAGGRETAGRGRPTADNLAGQCPRGQARRSGLATALLLVKRWGGSPLVGPLLGPWHEKGKACIRTIWNAVQCTVCLL